MRLPRYHEFFNPVLQALHDLGGSASIPELVEQVIKVTGLAPEVVDVMHSNGRTTAVEYRLSWARSYLKKVGLIENSERGVWSLTPEGVRTPHVDPKEVRRAVRQLSSAVPDDEGEPEGPPPSDEGEPTTDWRGEVLDTLRGMSASAFERLCQRLLRESGFIQVEVTGKSGDGGIDGHGIVRVAGLLSFPVIFQAKKYAGTVGANEVRNLRGAMVGRADKALLITTGTFTTPARVEATRDGAPPIDLVDGDALAEMLKTLRLGVRTKQVEQVEVDVAWFLDL